MSYIADRVKDFGVGLFVLAIYIALPRSFRLHFGDAAFTALACLVITLSTSPETYFRRAISAPGKRRPRNLAINWAGLLVSLGLAAAYAQHESPKRQMFRWRHGEVPRAIVLGILVFIATYFLLWVVYRRFVLADHYHSHKHTGTWR